MTGPSIKVDFGQIEAGAQHISSTAQQIDQLLEDLQRQIADLEQIWEGSAGGDFQQIKQKWNTSAQDLQSVLASIGTAVNAAHEAYTQTENANASSWQA